MSLKIIKAGETGFCFGVKRAINILEKAAKEYGSLETLGPVVHNDQVTEKLKSQGIQSIRGLEEIRSATVAISSHGVTPEIEAALRAKKVRVIDTTCPFVKRAQIAAKELVESGFYVIVYGESQHPEVKGILGWAKGQGRAVLDAGSLKEGDNLTRKMGVLSQTTQVTEKYLQFTKDLIDMGFREDAEIRIIDTICHDIRKRQAITFQLAGEVDLMLIVGGRTSANTRHLQEICSRVVESHLIEKADDIELDWLSGKSRLGIASGTSTAEETINEVIQHITEEDRRHNRQGS